MARRSADRKFLSYYDIDEEERGDKEKPWPDRTRDKVPALLLT